MPSRVAISTLNAGTIDILNTIRANASYEYQQLVPEVTKTTDIPKVGEVLYGYPALANQFINSLMNRIAFVALKSATFNNPYAPLKKGYLGYGETIEEVYVGLTKAREFSPEKASQRELKRTIPNVRTAFHAINWRVQYPITIQEEDLKQAFLSEAGVRELIMKIIDSVYRSAEYDEYLLFKYLMIKAISHGKMYPVSISGTDMDNAAIQFRGMSNDITFIKTKYNVSGVHTNTPKNDQYIFMDSFYNAQYGVKVLASAFNMSEVDYTSRVRLIDDWTSFDNERFSELVENTSMIEEVTADELALMANVKAVLVDAEWFQFYDILSKMTNVFVSSGDYWNYNYTMKKIVSSSPFANAIVFVDDANAGALPTSVTVEIESKEISEAGTIFTLEVDSDNPAITPSTANFVQTSDATEKGIAIHKYGAVIFPVSATTTTLEMDVKGTRYYAQTALTTAGTTGNTIVFKQTQAS